MEWQAERLPKDVSAQPFRFGLHQGGRCDVPRDEEHGGASAPPRGSDTPGKGHGRANSEDT